MDLDLQHTAQTWLWPSALTLVAISVLGLPFLPFWLFTIVTWFHQASYFGIQENQVAVRLVTAEAAKTWLNCDTTEIWYPMHRPNCNPTGFQSHQSWVTVGVSVVCAGVRLSLLCDMNHFWHLGRSLEKLVGQLCHSQGIQDLLGTYIYDWWLHFGHKVKYFSCYDWSLVSCAGRSVRCNVVLPIA